MSNDPNTLPKKSHGQIKREKRAAKQGSRTGHQGFMHPTLAKLMARSFNEHLRPLAVAKAVHALTHTGPWRIAAPGLGLVVDTETSEKHLAEMLLADRATYGRAWPGEFVIAPWRNDGLGSCRALIERGGDDLTPRDKIMDTLTTGVRLAKEDGRADVEMCMQALVKNWEAVLDAGL